MLERGLAYVVLAWLQISARVPVWLARRLSYPGGLLLSWFMRRRATVVARNLRHCFPDWDAGVVAYWRARMFRALAYSLYETALSWCRIERSQLPACRISGLQHIAAAQQQQQGVLLVCGHFMSMEITGRLIAEQVPLYAVYRPLRNRWLERYQNSSRGRYTLGLISKRQPRQILKVLRRGQVVWIAPDQDFGPQRSEFVDFFDQPAATLTAVWRLARASNAVVLTMQPQRLEDGSYQIDIQPPLPGVHDDQPQTLLQAMNQRIEVQVREQPDQYWWLHRRFKTRPEGMASIYADD